MPIAYMWGMMRRITSPHGDNRIRARRNAFGRRLMSFGTKQESERCRAPVRREGPPPRSCMTWPDAESVLMLDRSLQIEFESYRKTLSTAGRLAFDDCIERLLSQHGIDYVRGYVDALKERDSQ
jgi:hypothetical protein